jgi:hypothetical protein
VGDHHDRRAGELARRAQDLEDLGLDRHVQRRGRLVGDDHVRVVGDRHRDHHALAHATENSCGNASARSAACGMPTSLSSSTLRSRAACLETSL